LGNGEKLKVQLVQAIRVPVLRHGFENLLADAAQPVAHEREGFVGNANRQVGERPHGGRVRVQRPPREVQVGVAVSGGLRLFQQAACIIPPSTLPESIAWMTTKSEAW
jgi:hypothetical protein